MIEKFYVYRHRRLDNNQVFYIGISNNLKRPYTRHSRNNHWKNIVAKAGFEAEILHICGTWEEAKEVEVILISYYGRKDLGTGILVNKTDGGEGALGYKHPEEVRATMNKSRIGKPLSEAHIKNISEGHKGKMLSEETKAKISEKRRGKVVKESTRDILRTQNERPVIMLPQGVMFRSAKEAFFITGVNRNGIGEVCKGRQKSAGGFEWKYI